MVDLNALDDSLRGKVRGNPVAVSLFYSEIPEAYEKKKVVPCSILRHAMDKGEVVSLIGITMIAQQEFILQACMKGQTRLGMANTLL
ncbi:MAG: hypothetical protein Ct9H90mP13_01290 [Pseudomonadota bacterium]|nr:MAG: hypothetical protein Ct9H90mP13_01290 [Pseudomonadota bacterium]